MRRQPWSGGQGASDAPTMHGQSDRAAPVTSVKSMASDAEKRAFLASLPCDAESVLSTLTSIEDVWWVAAAAVAAVRTGTAWLAADAERVLAHALERSASFDQEVQAVLSKDVDRLLAWLDAEPDRLPRVVLRRKLWHMRWLLSIPLSRSKSALVETDMARLSDIPLLEHARTLCLAGNERALRALLGTNASVALCLYPHRFVLLRLLLTCGGVSPDHLMQLRLLPGTHLPVADRESGAWVDALGSFALWTEHPGMVSALARRGAATHPPAPPPPPPALSDWYMDVIRELEGRWGLVDAAFALAQAGERMGMVPLRAARDELAFLHMLVYELHAEAWSVSTLRAAKAADLVRLVVSHPAPMSETAQRLRDAVLPYLQHGTYADAHTLHAYSASALGVHIALMVLDTLSPARALPLVSAMLSWLDKEDQMRLTLVVIGAYDATDRASLAMYADMLRDVPLPDASPSPLYLVLSRAPKHDALALWKCTHVASSHQLMHAVRDVRVLVDMAQALAPIRAYAPSYLWGDDVHRHRAHRMAVELVQHALTQRGHERAALERILLALAPWIGTHAPYLPTECVRTLFKQLLLARAPILFNEVVHALPHTCPKIAALLSPEDAEALVLETARAWTEQAPTCDPLHGALQRARDTLDAVPPSPSVNAELSFLQLLGLLHEHASPLSPKDVRATSRLDLLARVLSSHRDAYRTAQPLARACMINEDDDVRIEAMLTDAAAASGDVSAALRSCDRLVTRVLSLDHTQHTEAYDVAWRTCFQLAKQPWMWPDHRAPTQVFGHALRLAPPEHISTILTTLAPLAVRASHPPTIPRRDAQPTHAWSRLLTRTEEQSTAQLLDSVATQHAPNAARVARSLFDMGAAWWNEAK